MCYTQVSTILCVSDSYSWSSYLKTGVLVAHGDETLTFRMEDTVLLTSHLSEKGRGAELSELIVFNGRLYTVDDRSGIGETAYMYIEIHVHDVHILDSLSKLVEER